MNGHHHTRLEAERLVAFYLEQHNTVMPCRAFDGRTPDEVCLALLPKTFGSVEVA